MRAPGGSLAWCLTIHGLAITPHCIQLLGPVDIILLLAGIMDYSDAFGELC